MGKLQGIRLTLDLGIGIRLNRVIRLDWLESIIHENEYNMLEVN